MWVSREEFKSLSERVSVLEGMVGRVDTRTKDYPVYSPIHFSDPPLARVPLWDMIHEIRRHLGLRIEAKPQSWELVEDKPIKIAKIPKITK